MKFLIENGRVHAVGRCFTPKQSALIQFLITNGPSTIDDLTQLGIKAPKRMIRILRKNGIYIIIHPTSYCISPDGEIWDVCPLTYEIIADQGPDGVLYV